MSQDIFVFAPIYFEKVWGGDSFKRILNRKLPNELSGPIGESWELCDRVEAVSVDIFSGMTLHELWSQRREEIFGNHAPNADRFPILVKLIDASENLSLQVHPPSHIAAKLFGEPKTEMWYFLHCQPQAIIYAGFSEKVSREKFIESLRSGSSEVLYHKIKVTQGDAMFLPSGRIHAIGAGNVLLEVQQNSDTTYRVDDWGRLGLDGKPRELHIQQALECIDFDDVRPALLKRNGDELVQCEFFTVKQRVLTEQYEIPGKGQTFVLLFVEKGQIQLAYHRFTVGQTVLISSSSNKRVIQPVEQPASVVLISWGIANG